ncbi:MAG: phosphoribosylanthranilate isomerase [Firmicutes bacterium]|nr:phosphoribosylanthranilate isomerase [Bacillota bacterium]
MTKIKICGLKSIQDILAVNKVLPNYIGFVFAESLRQIDAQKAQELKTYLHPAIKAVGVFVNEKMEKIIKLCAANVIDLVQLHGDEDEEYIKYLKKHVGQKIIKAVRVKDKESVKKALGLPCDYFLFDTYRQNTYGGTGKTFDWSLLPAIEKPYFLAGGINAGNVMQAINACRPYCIDVSSGVETRGRKDPEKIKKFVSLVRKAAVD